MSDVMPIAGWPDAYISRDGRVWRNGKEKTVFVSKVGYRTVNFSLKNKSHPMSLHRLLLSTFVGPCPDGCEALHINGDRLDNRLENLRWGTRKENVADAIRHGTATVGVRNGGAKLRESDLRFIDDLRFFGFTPREIAPHFTVTPATIRRVFSGETYKGNRA